MKRFKTKRELKKTNFDNWNNEGKMDYLFGLPVINKTGGSVEHHPELTKGCSQWYAYTDITTNELHPFDGLKLEVEVTPDQSEKLQKKAFAMGYRWQNSGYKIYHTESNFIHFNSYEDKRLTYSNGSRRISTLKLTYEQFMNGSLPKKKKMKKEITFTESELIEAMRGVSIETCLTNEILKNLTK